MTPQRTRVKICGIRNAAAAAAAAEAGADAIGVVLAPGSPRTVDLPQARAIVQALPGWVAAVGLFVDEPPSEIASTAQSLGLSVVQLHGQETLGVVAELAPLRAIKAVGITRETGAGDLDVWRHGPRNLAALLLDVSAGGGVVRGGTGQKLDWEVLEQLTAAGAMRELPPLVLAGGLTPENVGEAIRRLRPWGVDVSSGVESRRGEKDLGRIRSFCQAVRDADTHLR